MRVRTRAVDESRVVLSCRTARCVVGGGGAELVRGAAESGAERSAQERAGDIGEGECDFGSCPLRSAKCDALAGPVRAVLQKVIAENPQLKRQN